MRAYDELYVSVAQDHLGSALDFAVNACGLELAAFYRAFLACGLSRAFERGNPSVLAGRSGIDLALGVMEHCVMGHGMLGKPTALFPSGKPGDAWASLGGCSTGGDWPDSGGCDSREREIALEDCRAQARGFSPLGGASSEFWTGWALAYYQWASARTFGDINEAVPISRVHELYHPLHEQDISSFCERMEGLYRQAFPQTALQRMRLAAGMSQAQLAQAAQVPVRTLQQYEQRQKNIDKAQVSYVLQLSHVLHCAPEALLEHSHMQRYEYEVVSCQPSGNSPFSSYC